MKYKVVQGTDQYLYSGLCDGKLIKGQLGSLTQEQLTVIKKESPEYPFITEDTKATTEQPATEQPKK